MSRVSFLFLSAMIATQPAAGLIVRSDPPVPIGVLAGAVLLAGIAVALVSIRDKTEKRASPRLAAGILKKAEKSGIDVSDIPDLIRQGKLRSIHFSRRGILLLVDREGDGEIRFRDMRVRLKKEQIVRIDPVAVEITLANLAGVPYRDFEPEKMSDDEIKFLLFGVAIA